MNVWVAILWLQVLSVAAAPVVTEHDEWCNVGSSAKPLSAGRKGRLLPFSSAGDGALERALVLTHAREAQLELVANLVVSLGRVEWSRDTEYLIVALEKKAFVTLCDWGWPAMRPTAAANSGLQMSRLLDVVIALSTCRRSLFVTAPESVWCE